MDNPLWSSKEISMALNCKIKSDFQAYGVSIDSRTVQKGDIFVAVKGPIFDGHNFINHAISNGAVAIIAEFVPDDVNDDQNIIVVENVLLALEHMAIYARSRSNATIIAITGSFGKTSVKDALFHVISSFGKTLATERSFNNHLGLPLTMSRLHQDHQYAVIEMGMNNLGEIKRYSEIVRPHIAIINNIGNAHIGNMYSMNNIAQAKSEIFFSMDTEGFAILNDSDQYYNYLVEKAQDKGLKLINFSQDVKHEVTQDGIVISGKQNGKLQNCTVKMQTFAPHWVFNISGILNIIKLLQLDLNLACNLLSDFNIANGRGGILKVKSNNKNITILDESYNAGLQSMKNAIVALKNMIQHNQGRGIAILGDMLELGEYTESYHKELLDDLLTINISKVYCCGEYIKYLYDVLPNTVKAGYAKDPALLIAKIKADIQERDVYMVKGSRGQWDKNGRMSVFVDALQS